MRNGFIVMALCSSLSACGSSPSGTAPSTTTIPPDQSKYEALPTGQHRLLDAAGNKTNMWVQLTKVSPDRGSSITTGTPGPTGCTATGCFQFSVTVGLINVPNPNTVAAFTVGFSPDGQNISTELLGIGTTTSTTPSTDPTRIWAFKEVPQYLVVQGSYRGDTNGPFGTFPGESGMASFLLDYKPK